jgi:hypothetical protein
MGRQSYWYYTSNNKDAGEWFTGGTVDQLINFSVGCLTVLIIGVMISVYVADYQTFGRRTMKKVEKLHFKKIRNPFKYPDHNETTKRWFIRNLNRIKFSMMNPTWKHLHRYTIGVSVCTIVYVSGYCITVSPSVPFKIARVASSFDLAFYAFTKLLLGAFFIVRYQITSRDLNRPRPMHIFGLWMLNITSFCLQFSTVFANPPYIDMVNLEYGFVASVIFIGLDSVMHVILLYMFLSPLTKHVQDIKVRLKVGSSQNIAGMNSVHKESDFGSVQLRAAASKSVIQNDAKRIEQFENIIRKASISDALAVFFTILENTFYVILVYNVNATLMAQAEASATFWSIGFGYASDLEALICALCPILNYGRWLSMWSVCFRERNDSELEVLKELPTLDNALSSEPEAAKQSRAKKFPSQVSSTLKEPLMMNHLRNTAERFKQKKTLEEVALLPSALEEQDALLEAKTISESSKTGITDESTQRRKGGKTVLISIPSGKTPFDTEDRNLLQTSQTSSGQPLLGDANHLQTSQASSIMTEKTNLQISMASTVAAHDDKTNAQKEYEEKHVLQVSQSSDQLANIEVPVLDLPDLKMNELDDLQTLRASFSKGKEATKESEPATVRIQSKFTSVGEDPLVTYSLREYESAMQSKHTGDEEIVAFSLPEFTENEIK